VASTHLDIAGEDRGEELIKATSDLPGQPPFAARLTFLHGNFEHDGDLAVSLGELGPLDRLPITLIALFAPHQRLLR